MRDRIAPALVVLLGVLAVATTATTIDATRPSPSVGDDGAGGSGFGEGGGTGWAVGDGSGLEVSRGAVGELAYDATWLLAVAAAVLLLPLVVAVYRYGLDAVIEFLRAVATQLLAVAMFVAFAALVGWLLFLSPSGAGGLSSPQSTDVGGSGAAGVDANAPVSPDLPVLALLLGAVVVVLAVAVYVIRTGSLGPFTSLTSRTTEPAGADDGVDDRTRGRWSFDRSSSFDDEDATNAVYRAWSELADATDGADLRTDTPGEIARRAVEAGADREAVRTITLLFDEVRYGRRPADDDRERRATSAVETIEGGGEDA